MLVLFLFFCISCGLAWLRFSFAVFDAFYCVLVWLLRILVVVSCWGVWSVFAVAGGLLLVVAVVFISCCGWFRFVFGDLLDYPWLEFSCVRRFSVVAIL